MTCFRTRNERRCRTSSNCRATTGDNEPFELADDLVGEARSREVKRGAEPRNRGGTADGFRGRGSFESARLLGLRKNTPARDRSDSALQAREISAFSLVDSSGMAGKPKATMTCDPWNRRLHC